MTRINVEIDGLAQLLGQLKSLGAVADDVVRETITDLVTDTHAFAVEGIQRGPKSGRVYEYYFFTDGSGRLRQGKKRDKAHQASAPGQYPASDSGRLASSVRMVFPTASSMSGEVGTASKVGKFMEFGTAKIAARPWLLPSFVRAKVGVEKELKLRIEAMTK